VKGTIAAVKSVAELATRNKRWMYTISSPSGTSRTDTTLTHWIM